MAVTPKAATISTNGNAGATRVANGDVPLPVTRSGSSMSTIMIRLNRCAARLFQRVTPPPASKPAARIGVNRDLKEWGLYSFSQYQPSMRSWPATLARIARTGSGDSKTMGAAVPWVRAVKVRGWVTKSIHWGNATRAAGIAASSSPRQRDRNRRSASRAPTVARASATGKSRATI